MGMTSEEINGIGKKVADQVMVAVKELQTQVYVRDAFVGGYMGDGAIPLDGREKIKAPCTGCRIDPSKPFEPGNAMLTTHNAIGTLSKEEAETWCSELIEEKNGRCRRAWGIHEAAKECKGKYPNDTAGYFGCFINKFREVA